MRRREALTDELGYLAGIVDGEGYIGANAGNDCLHRFSRFQLRVAMCDPQPAELLADLYGGAIQIHARPAGRRTLFVWDSYGDRAAGVLADLLPYLRVKRGQAEALLEARNTFHNRTGQHAPISEQDYLLRDICGRRVRQLNQRVIGGP